MLLAPDGAIRALVGGVDHRAFGLQPRHPGPAPAGLGVQALRLRRGAGGRGQADRHPQGRAGPLRPLVPDQLRRRLSRPGHRGRRPGPFDQHRRRRLADEVGGPRIGEIAHRFGLKSIPDDPNLSVALGAYEVNLLELTAGLPGVPAGRPADRALSDRRDHHHAGRCVLQPMSLRPGPPVYDAAHAGDMVRMMEGVITHGTGDPRRVRPPGRRQDRHQPELARRLVHRLHPGLALRGLDRQRRQLADEQDHRRRDARRDLAQDDDPRAPDVPVRDFTLPPPEAPSGASGADPPTAEPPRRRPARPASTTALPGFRQRRRTVTSPPAEPPDGASTTGRR